MSTNSNDSADNRFCPCNLLVIDSDRENNLKIQETLKKQGLKVHSAICGEEGLKKAAKIENALILLSYQLDDMKAEDLVKKLKKVKGCHPLIIMVESHDEKHAAQMLRKGAHEYLIKESGFLDILPALIEKTIHEITIQSELINLKEALRISEEKYNFVFENASIPMAILGINDTFLMVNGAFQKLSGFKKKELEGKTNWKSLVYQRDLKKIENPRILSLAAPGISLVNYEFRLLSKLDIMKDIFLTVSCLPKHKWKIASFLDVSAIKQTEKALQQSEKQFQSLIKNIPGIVYLCSCDEHWTMHYMVKEVERISGYPASDFINNNVRSYASIVHPDDLEMVEEAIRKGVEANKPYEMEYRIIRKDGQIIWVFEKGQRVYNDENKMWLNGIIFDITERKQTSVALDIATQEWQVTFDTIPSAVFLLNRECRVMKCNHAATKLLNRKKNDIIGKRYCVDFDNFSDSSGDNLFMKMLKSGRKKKQIKEFGGKIYNFTIVPIKTPHGDIYGSVLISENITKIKKAEQEIKDKNKELESIFHTAPVGMGVVSQRVLMNVNDEICRLCGYTKKELLGKSVENLYPDRETFLKVGKLYQNTTGRQITILESSFKRKDGSIFRAKLRISPINNEINGFTFTAVEI